MNPPDHDGSASPRVRQSETHVIFGPKARTYGAIVSSPLLVLWDIDHTLIETGGVGSEVYAAAFEKVTGQPLEELPDISGRTEPAIFREALAHHGIDDPGDLFARFAEEQAWGYSDRIAELRRRGRALPGAAEALQALSTRGDVIQSVLTGNTGPSARIKLAAFGLDGFLDLDIASYGTDSDIRAQLVGVARQRATGRTGDSFGPDSTVLVGDTPADVVAAGDGDARIIAVATGRHTVADLAAAGASDVLADLSDTQAFVAILYRGESPQ
jgi:phosphoglycolate phosphatase-like HAD superfamily hydrolase